MLTCDDVRSGFFLLVKIMKEQLFLKEYLKNESASEAVLNSYGYESKTGTAYYVYALIADDTDEIIYIGKGKGNRVYSHVKASKNGRIDNAPKHKAIQEILKRGSKIREMIIESDLSERKALAVEKYLIENLKDKLTNIANGSQHNLDKCIERAKHYVSKLKPIDVWLKTMPNKYWVEICKEDERIAKQIYNETLDFWNMIINNQLKNHAQ